MYVCMLYFAENKKVMAAAANPVREPCDIGVKLADLGNACWTVSYITLLLHYIIIASAPEYKKIYDATSVPGHWMGSRVNP